MFHRLHHSRSIRNQSGLRFAAWVVAMRPWCWEVAGPLTVAAWFTTPAVPPHRVSRWRSNGGRPREVVPQTWLCLSVFAASVDRQTCKNERDKRTNECRNFLWAFSPADLDVSARPPYTCQALDHHSEALAAPALHHCQKKNPSLCKCDNQSGAPMTACVRTVKRDLSLYLAYQMSWD